MTETFLLNSYLIIICIRGVLLVRMSLLHQSGRHLRLRNIHRFRWRNSIILRPLQILVKHDLVDIGAYHSILYLLLKGDMLVLLMEWQQL